MPTDAEDTVLVHHPPYGAGDAAAMRAAVDAIIAQTPITDLHTHLYAPPFGELLLWGIDELLTYHYLIAEVVRAANVPPDRFWSTSNADQAALIWDELFIKRVPFSEACRGVVTVLHKLGLDTDRRNLDEYRAWFREHSPEAMIDKTFEVANLESVVMTNDPFDPLERPVWESGYNGDPRFHAVLRIDPLLNDWARACEQLKGWGFDVEPSLSAKTTKEVRRFLDTWVTRMKALYMAVSLPPEFAFPDESPRSTLISQCIVPVAREHNIPFAMMIGVRRALNPALKLAGDGVGKADLGAVERICAAFPENKFMCTMLSRENQHELCVAGRKFPNLFLFGCWWFLNNPSLIEEMTRMRFELLGSSVAPQHSDARVLEQVIYKWDHSRRIIARVLADKYADLLEAGWRISDDDIRRDVQRLFSGNFWDFVKR